MNGRVPSKRLNFSFEQWFVTMNHTALLGRKRIKPLFPNTAIVLKFPGRYPSEKDMK